MLECQYTTQRKIRKIHKKLAHILAAINKNT